MPTILATQEARSEGSQFKASLWQIVLRDPISILPQKTKQNKRAGGVAQGVGPELKPQYCQKKKTNLFASMRI
jgi:hypothetical protein